MYLYLLTYFVDHHDNGTYSLMELNSSTFKVGFIERTNFVNPCFKCYPLCPCKKLGMDAEIFVMLSKFLNFTYEFISPENDTWGNCKTGRIPPCIGLMDLLYRNVVDTTVVQFAMRAESRVEWVDWSLPVDAAPQYFTIASTLETIKLNFITNQIHFQIPLFILITILLKWSIDQFQSRMMLPMYSSCNSFTCYGVNLYCVSPSQCTPYHLMLTKVSNSLIDQVGIMFGQTSIREITIGIKLSDITVLTAFAILICNFSAILTVDLSIVTNLKSFKAPRELAYLNAIGTYHRIIKATTAVPLRICPTEDVICEEYYKIAKTKGFVIRTKNPLEIPGMIATSSHPKYYYRSMYPSTLFEYQRFLHYKYDLLAVEFKEFPPLPSAWFFRKGFKHRSKFDSAFVHMSQFTRTIKHRYYDSPLQRAKVITRYNRFKADKHLYEAWMLLLVGYIGATVLAVVEVIGVRFKFTFAAECAADITEYSVD